MRILAEYVMRGRKQAIIAALLLSFVPFMGWLSDAIIALVTLRQGPKEGGIVLLWAILPVLVIAVNGHPLFGFYNALGGTGMIYCLALVLRSSNSWAWVLQTVAMLGIIAVTILHLWWPEFGTAWVKSLQGYIKVASAYFNLPNDGAGLKIATPMIKIAIGTQIAILLFSDLVSLYFARWWQAILYNPQGLTVELRGVRLGLGSVGLLVLILALSLTGVDLAIDCMPVIALPFLLAGLSLSHYWLATKQASKLWLIILYSLLTLFFPYMAVILIVWAVLDAGLNIRRRFRVM